MIPEVWYELLRFLLRSPGYEWRWRENPMWWTYGKVLDPSDRWHDKYIRDDDFAPMANVAEEFLMSVHPAMIPILIEDLVHREV